MASDKSPDEIMRTAAAILATQAAGLAFDATVGAIEATVAAPGGPEPAAGPRTLDARSLPLLPVSGGGGDDIVVGATIGQGGMGVVVLARQQSLQRDVAVKRPHDDANEGAVSALLREAVFTGFLEHPAIVPVHALGRDAAGHPLMLMKKIDGVALDEMLADDAHRAWSRSGPDAVAVKLEIARRVCDALAFAHSRGVIHRDVKPANVMIGEFGEVYLLDWGIAMRKGETQRADAICGTLAYMAPEMLAPASGHIDERTDVYLVGALLHECFTKRPPHAHPKLDDVLASIMRPTPLSYGSDVPDEVAVVLRRAMAYAPRDRYESTAALGKALARAGELRAAAELARTGTERLDDLERAIDAGAKARVRQRFYECRFAFAEALRDWPEGEAAQKGLERALATMARFEIAERNADAAHALLEEMKDPPAALRDALATLRKGLEREGADLARLRRIDHDQDPRIGRRERTAVTQLAAVIIVVTAVLVLGLHQLHVLDMRTDMLSWGVGPTLLLVLFVLYRFRSGFFANRLNRQIGFTLMCMFVLISTNRLTGGVSGKSLADVVHGDALVAATAAALSALTLRRVLFIPALLFLAASVAAPFLGDLSFMALVVAAGGSLLSLITAPKALLAPALDKPDPKA
jgi:serine/threonine-protein kinase